MKKTLRKIIFLMAIALFSCSVNAQVTVTGSTAADGPYATLGAAFAAINAGPQTGNTISVVLSANTTETATAALTVNDWTSLTVTATTPVVITGNIVGAVIRLNGADNVTIDGRIAGVGRNITVSNTSTTTATAAVWLSSNGPGAGATNNTIRNLEISCGATQNTSTTTTFGIIMSGTTISATSNGDDNDNNTFTENRIIRCRYGIVTRGVTTNNNTNIQVTNNIIGPASFGSDQIGKTGILMQADFQSAVTGNVVQFVGGDYANTTGGADRVGIAIGVDSWSNAPGTITSSFYLVSNNLVHDIIDERTFSAVGILMGTTNGGLPTSNVVTNNMIYNVKANGTAGDATVGLGISGGHSDQIMHNSIYLYGDVDPNASATATTMYGSGIRIANASSANHANLILRYNIVHMDLMSSSTAAVRYYAISGNSAAYSFGTGGENYNDYYINPVNTQLMTGGLGNVSGNTLAAQFATLANWQGAYTAPQDANSFQVDPAFTSTSDLHIVAATTTLLESGAAGSPLTLDFDSDTRPGPAGSVNGGATAPDVGADEFDGTPLSVCTGTPAASNAQSTAASVCSGVNFSVSLDITYTELGYTYQWQSSPDGISYSNITGATNAAYTTNQTAATYYQCIITCTNSGLSTTSSPVLVNMNSFFSCYCTVTFPSNVEPITLVNFAGINNTTSEVLNGTPALENFTAMTANVNKGYTYPITLKGNTDGNFTTYLSVFIDFNQNGSFADAGETFNIGTITNSTGIDAIQLTGNITIPMTAMTGLTGMRVIKKYNANALPCNNTGYGQAEDYTIMINPCVPPATVTLTADDADGAICPGTNVLFTGQSGFPYYDFQINAGSVQTGAGATYSNAALANNDVVGLIAGYDVTCATAATSITITHHAVPSGTIAPFDASCNGAADGSMDLTVTGGTPSFTYLWSNAATSEDISGLIAGTYSVVITDANGCTGNASAGIAEPAAINVSVTSVNPSCFGMNDGSIDLTVSGGVGSFVFDWDNDGTGDFDDTEDLASLTAGTYNGVVMDGNGCTDAGTVILIEPALLTVTANTTDISCNGLTDGAVDVTVTGGTTAYTFDWDTDGTGDFDDAEDLTGLVSGTFNLVVEDANGCAATVSATVNEPAILSATASPVDILCNGANSGTIDLTVTGGTTTYTFDWDNDGTGDNDDSEDLSSLSAGSYTVMVTDSRGCTTTASAGITEPAAINVSVTSVNVSCFGFNDGSIDITVSGGVGSFVFDWDNDGTGDFDDTEDLSSLAAGTYNGVVMDANGCTDGGSVTISQPATLSVTKTVTHISCNGLTDGAINLIVTGGTSGYVYDWDIDGTGDFDDPQDLSGLAAGTYNVTVVDANGCIGTNAGMVIEPAVLSSSLTSVDILCNGDNTGSVDLSVTGGTTPYQYDWDNDGTGDFNDPQDLVSVPAGTYNVVIEDNRGCTTTNTVTLSEPTAIAVSVVSSDISCFGQTDGFIDITVSGGAGSYVFDWDNDGTGDFDDTEDLLGLSAGTYTGVLMDANGCTDGGTIVINEPGLLDLTVVTSDITCNGLTDGMIDLTVAGGTAPFTIDWDNDGTGDNDDTEDLNGLASGNYFVFVMDTRGCSDTISASIIEPAVLSLTLTYSDITCNGYNDGQADVVATGGTLPYSVDWDIDGTGDTDDSLSLDSLTAGTYTIVVTDLHNCAVLDSTFTIIDPLPVTISMQVTDAICSNIGNGMIDLSISGGTGSYTFLWSNNATTEDLVNVAAGIYYLVAYDDNGCNVYGNDTVDFENEAPTVTLVLTMDTICNTGGVVTLAGGSPSGGNYSGTGVTGTNFDPSVSGTGNFTIMYTFTDTTGCFNVSSDVITVDDCTGIGEIEENYFSLFPNPTVNTVTLRTSEANGRIRIVDAIGKSIYVTDIRSNETTIDLSMHERGVYMVILETETGAYVQKLVKN